MNPSSIPLDIAALREEYSQRHLRRRDLDADPMAQFSRWLEEAVAARLKDPNAMTLATVNAEGRPSIRAVLLKGAGPRGFQFFSNYGSRKAADLESNSQAALNFLWPELERQVCIQGRVRKGTREEAERYFHSRPTGSQLGAWASRQSQIVPSREWLEEKVAQVASQFQGREVPLPDFWGGYWLTPAIIEFWQGGPGRIHDRLQYLRQGETWRIDRLSP